MEAGKQVKHKEQRQSSFLVEDKFSTLKIINLVINIIGSIFKRFLLHQE